MILLGDRMAKKVLKWLWAPKEPYCRNPVTELWWGRGLRQRAELVPGTGLVPGSPTDPHT
jgi:hypothetical protein